MEKGRSNKFKRALTHLKSTTIDEKLQLLSEVPTNSTSGIYTDDPREPITITTELNTSLDPLDLSQDGGNDGRDTSGLFMPDGTILAEEPPGDTSYILGPMAAMFYTYSYPWTMVGYIRQGDRQFVNLGRIDGKLSEWNGSVGDASENSGTFRSYGQLTAEQALWFKDAQKQPGININDASTWNYYAFYPGPPGQTPDAHGRYPCVISGQSKRRTETTPGETPGTMKGFADDPHNYRHDLDKKKREEYAEYLNGLMSKAPGTLTPEEEQALIDAGLDDFVKGGMKTTDIFGDLATIGAAAAAVKAGLALAGNAIVQGILGFAKHASGTYGTVKTAEIMSDVITSKIPGLVGNANNAGDYNAQLATKLPISILTGTPQEIKLSDKAKRDQINNVSETQFEKALQFGRASAPSANSTVNPTPGLKKPILTKTSGWGAQGGSEVHYDPKADTLTITSEKMLRTGQSGDQFDITRGGRVSNGQVVDRGKQTRFGDIPDADPKVVENLTRDILNVPGVVDVGAFLGSPEYVKMKKNPAYREEVIGRVSQMANDLTSSGVQGVASNTVAFRKALTDAGLLPKSEIEKTGGGYGQVFSQTEYKGNEIPKTLRDIINKKTRQNESFGKYTRKKLIKEIKKPYVVKEIKQEKLKGYRPRVTGGGINTEPDKLMLKSENPASFKPMDETVWTKQDKYYNARLSQERKNEILDHLGTTHHYWQILTETGRKSNAKAFQERYGDYKVVRKEQLTGDTLLLFADENGNKESMLQSEYQNMIARQIEEPLYEQEKLKEPKDTLSKRIKDKLGDYPNKPSKAGYPNEPPPKMVNGYHPEYGKRSNYYNRLDPQSAKSMPTTGDPEIDAKVASQKTSSLKPVRSVKGKPNT